MELTSHGQMVADVGEKWSKTHLRWKDLPLWGMRTRAGQHNMSRGEADTEDGFCIWCGAKVNLAKKEGIRAAFIWRLIRARADESTRLGCNWLIGRYRG